MSKLREVLFRDVSGYPSIPYKVKSHMNPPITNVGRGQGPSISPSTTVPLETNTLCSPPE